MREGLNLVAPFWSSHKVGEETGELDGVLLSERKGRLWFDQDQVVSGEVGPYDRVGCFGRSLESLQMSSKVGYRPDGVTEWAVDSKETVELARGITHLANSGMEMDRPALGVIYTAGFVAMFGPVLESVVKQVAENERGEGVTLIAPLRGGEVVHAMCRAMGMDGLHIPLIRQSRVMTVGGRYSVGLRVEEMRGDKLRNRVVFADDCVAALGSAVTALRWAREQGRVERVGVAVGFGVARSMSRLVSVVNEIAGGQEVPVVQVARIARAMDDDYYLALTEAERQRNGFPSHYQMTVNDMGKAMSLRGGRDRVLRPVIEAVVEGRITGGDIKAAVEQVRADAAAVKVAADGLLDRV